MRAGRHHESPFLSSSHDEVFFSGDSAGIGAESLGEKPVKSGPGIVKHPF